MSNKVQCTFLPHPLTYERRVFEADCRLSITDIVQEHVRDTPKELVHVAHNSVFIPQERWATHEIAPNDDLLIRVVPQGEGVTSAISSLLPKTDAQAVGKQATGGLFAIAGLAILLLSGSVWGVVVLALAGELFVAGSAYFMSKTYKNKTLKRPGLEGGSNAANPNGKVPMIYGRRIISPNYAMLPFSQTSYTGADTSTLFGMDKPNGQYLFVNLLFIIGYSGLKLSKFKLGKSLLATNVANVRGSGASDRFVPIDGELGGCELSIHQDGTLPTWAEHVVKEVQPGTSLDRWTNDFIDSDGVAHNFTGSRALTVSAAYKTITLVDTSVNWGETYDVQIGDYVLFDTINSGAPLKVTNVSNDTLTCFHSTLTSGTYTPASFIRYPGNYITSPKNTQRFSVTIEFQSGLATWAKGRATPCTVSHKTFYRVHDKDAPETHPWVQCTEVFNGEASAISLTKMLIATARFTQEMNVPTSGDNHSVTGEYDILVTRYSNDRVSDEYTYTDKATWTTCRFITNRVPVCAEWLTNHKVCIVGLRVKASVQLSNTLQEFNCVAEMDYTQNPLSADSREIAIRAAERSPAAALLFAITGPYNPRPVPLSLVDLDALLAWKVQCEDEVYVPGTPDVAVPLHCDVVTADSATFRDTLTYLASAGRAIPTVLDARYSIIPDFDHRPVTNHITPFNSWGFSFTKSFVEIPHALKISFDNEDEDEAHDETIVLGDGYLYDTEKDGYLYDFLGVRRSVGDPISGSTGTYQLATKFESQALIGITSPIVAKKMGRWIWACRKVRNETYRVSMDAEQLSMTSGDRVLVSYDTITACTSQGRIRTAVRSSLLVGTDPLTSVVTDQGCTFEYGHDYDIKIRSANSLLATRLVNPTTATNTPITTCSLTLETPAVLPDVADDDIFFFGLCGLDSVDALVTGVEMGDNLSATLSLIKYAGSSVYAADTQLLPPHVSAISSAAASIMANTTRGVTEANAKDNTGATVAGVVAGAVDSVPETIATVAPRYLGRYANAHPATYNPGDSWTRYHTSDGTPQRGVWYSNAGTATRIEPSTETDPLILAKLPAAMQDIAWIEAQGTFGTAESYGFTAMFQILGAVTAFIQALFVSSATITVTPGANIVKQYSLLPGENSPYSSSSTYVMAAFLEHRVLFQIGASGTVRVYFNLISSDGNAAYGMVYKKGLTGGTFSEVTGTERQTSTTGLGEAFTVDVGCVTGDYLALYFKKATAGTVVLTNISLRIAESAGILSCLGYP